MKPVDVIRLAGKIDKRALLVDLVTKGDNTFVEQILAPMWKHLDADYVRGFMLDSASVRVVCTHRACPVDKSIDVLKDTTIAAAKAAFNLGFFTVSGTPLVPFVNGQRVGDDYKLQGGEVVEFRMP